MDVLTSRTKGPRGPREKVIWSLARECKSLPAKRLEITPDQGAHRLSVPYPPWRACALVFVCLHLSHTTGLTSPHALPQFGKFLTADSSDVEMKAAVMPASAGTTLAPKPPGRLMNLVKEAQVQVSLPFTRHKVHSCHQLTSAGGCIPAGSARPKGSDPRILQRRTLVSCTKFLAKKTL